MFVLVIDLTEISRPCRGLRRPITRVIAKIHPIISSERWRLGSLPVAQVH